jgi:tRNA A-37 threonylcarbamoyl transferase component Bud32
MKILTITAYRQLIEGAEPLASEFVDGELSHKVFRLADQSILKLFRIKRLFSSARLFPYARRFQRNVAYLVSCGVPTMTIASVYRIPAIKRTAVHYHPLNGMTLRKHCESNPIDSALAGRLGLFFHSLHKNGIYFRSIHFDNMILTEDDDIGLIDVVDMRISNGPLSMGRRIRNLRHLFRYQADVAHLTSERHRFMDVYCRNAKLSPRQEDRLRRHFDHYFCCRNPKAS